MTKEEVIQNLKLHNQWRTGEELVQMETKVITETINEAIRLLSCPHNHQRWEGKPPKRICQDCGADRTTEYGW